MENFGKFCITILFLIIGTIIGGFVFMKLYGWIICAIYDLRPITIPQAIGISTISSFLLLGVTINQKSDVEDEPFMLIVFKKFIECIAMYGIYLLIGYLISLFI